MELDVFPEELRKQAVGIGQVLKMDMYPSDRVMPKKGADHKEKRFVIIGKKGDKLVAALLINSQINPNLFFRIGPYQHEISADKYDFLDHTSYIDGYSIREFDAQRVMKSAKYLGAIESDDLVEVVGLVCSSPDVKPYLLKKYGLRKGQVPMAV